jgi:hypothetical protein
MNLGLGFEVTIGGRVIRHGRDWLRRASCLRFNLGRGYGGNALALKPFDFHGRYPPVSAVSAVRIHLAGFTQTAQMVRRDA